ncbi:MAG: L,D-transpeptidase [Bdellovibrio sp.]
MKVLKYGVLALTLAISQTSSAVSVWNKIKNAFNDCEYSDEQLKAEVPYEMMQTPKLPEHFSGKFSERDFTTKPWMREFQYVIVVNKAKRGPYAQTERLYENGYLINQAVVSTGREGFELRRKNQVCAGRPPKSYWSQTPTGYYTPKYLEEDHTSSSWDSEMPWAIFFDVDNGLALHQVHPHYKAMLGSRASGGCVRQDPYTAQFVYEKVLATEGAVVPEVNVDGTPVLDENGNIKHINKQVVVSKTGLIRSFKTYSALIIIED